MSLSAYAAAVFTSVLLLVPYECRAGSPPDPLMVARAQPSGTVYRIRPELFWAGLAVFGTTYTLSLAAATIASSDSTKSCALPSKRDCPNPLQPLFLPVVGPFWMMGRIRPPESREYGQIAYFTLGMAQFAGLTAMVLGLIPRLETRDGFSVSVTPAAGGANGTGLGLDGTF
jgi:hypothetical protein